MKKQGKALAKLECGNISGAVDGNDKLGIIQSTLQGKMIFFTHKLLSCPFDKIDAQMLAPFYARNILETSSTALLTRFDPFRLTIAYNVQNDTSYEIGAQSSVAIQWSQDILASKPPSKGLWHFENKLTDFSRALFSKYQGEIIWKPAFLLATDYISEESISTPWMDEFLNLDEDSFFEFHRVRAQTLFSSFSKGVHSEALVDISMIYDEVTLRTLSIDLLKWCTMLGLVSHFSPSSLFRLSPRTALNNFLQSERMTMNALQ